MLVRDAGVKRGALVPEPERSLIDNRVREYEIGFMGLIGAIMLSANQVQPRAFGVSKKPSVLTIAFRFRTAPSSDRLFF